MRKWLFPFKSM